VGCIFRNLKKITGAERHTTLLVNCWSQMRVWLQRWFEHGEAADLELVIHT
jgi:hypothetical protein